MNNLKLILLFIMLNSVVFAETVKPNIDNANLARIEKLENENIEMKAKIEAYNDNNSSILNTVSITIGVLLGIFGIVNITQVIQNHRLNNKRIEDVKSELKTYFLTEIDTKVNSKVSSKLFEINNLKKELEHIEIKILSFSCPSIDSQNIDTEISRLTNLLEKSLKYYDGRSFYEFMVEIPLNGIINHFEKHSVSDYEKEDVYKALLNEKLTSSFDFKINKIRELMTKS